MSNIVVPVLSVTIGLFFVFVGTIKLTPFVSEEFYKEMRKMFIKFARVFPLATLTGWKPDAQMYRRVFGMSEVICGLLLALIPGSLKQLANIVLFLLMCLSAYSHYAMKDGLDKMTPECIFGLLLICRYIVRLQIKSREFKEAQAAASNSTHAVRGEHANGSSVHHDSSTDTSGSKKVN